MHGRQRCTADHNGRSFLDEGVVVKGLDHEQGVVHSVAASDSGLCHLLAAQTIYLRQAATNRHLGVGWWCCLVDTGERYRGKLMLAFTIELHSSFKGFRRVQQSCCD
jgi:hypothetical protein